MVSFSLCMIVKNEEVVLDRCLSCVKPLFDEIIIVDTGSTDKTKLIAKNYTNEVYDFKWRDDFSAARNYAFSKATKDFVMWLDADDVINTKNINKLLKLKESLTTNVDIVMLKYAVSFDNNNKPTFTFFRERILNRSKNFLFQDPVHEAIVLRGNVIYEDIIIEHRKIKENAPKRNLKIYENLLKKGANFSPRQQFYYSRELYYNNKIKKAIKNFKIFLNMQEGFIENQIEACYMLSKCYFLLKKYNEALESLFKSFAYGTPRAEICSEIGYILRIQHKYSLAIYWLNMALKIKPNYNSGAFIQEELYRFVPYLELCVCYYYLSDYNKSYYYNNQAKKLNPNHPSVINNEIFLKKFITQK